ncbi:MAG: hypothetical protein AABY10_03645 [Nanoarchaeota archaeon]
MSPTLAGSLIIGKVVDAKTFGLESKVGKGETLVSVPKDLIDKMERRNG